jgi:hypothetical protein
MGSSSKGQIPHSKINFGPIKTVFGGLVAGPQHLQNPQKKFDFGARRQCVVNDRDHLQDNEVNLFVLSFF